MKKRFFILFLLSLTLITAVALAGSDSVLYQKNDSGEEILVIKARLAELGYYSKANYGKVYTDDTVSRVKRFQETNGLEATGVICQQDWDRLFSAEALAAGGGKASGASAVLTPTPSTTPAMTPSPTPAPAVSSESIEASAPTPPPSLPYKVGKKSDQTMLCMKKRLYALGYLQSMAFAGNYTDVTEQAVKYFQEANGLPVTGQVSAKDWNAIFSEDAISAFDAGIYPSPTPLCTQRPLADEASPAFDEEGYLAGEGEYVYENDELGQWVYRTSDIQVTINRYENPDLPLEWFESEIYVRNGEALRSVRLNSSTKRTEMHFSSPAVLAQQNKLIFAFTDDFFDYRFYRGQTVGIVIRNGEILSSKTYRKRARKLPNMDMMAQFSDGTLKCYALGEITAQELLDLGAINVYCFGPIILRNGEIDECLNYRSYLEKFPRQFLGMIEPNHYFLLTVSGRTDNSEGIRCQDAANMLLARNVKEALNLDGGNTMAIVFRGRMLNKAGEWQNQKYIRSVSSLIGVGIGDYAAEETEDAVENATHP